MTTAKPPSRKKRVIGKKAYDPEDIERELQRLDKEAEDIEVRVNALIARRGW